MNQADNLTHRLFLSPSQTHTCLWIMDSCFYNNMTRWRSPKAIASLYLDRWYPLQMYCDVRNEGVVERKDKLVCTIGYLKAYSQSSWRRSPIMNTRRQQICSKAFTAGNIFDNFCLFSKRLFYIAEKLGCFGSSVLFDPLSKTTFIFSILHTSNDNKVRRHQNWAAYTF